MPGVARIDVHGRRRGRSSSRSSERSDGARIASTRCERDPCGNQDVPPPHHARPSDSIVRVEGKIKDPPVRTHIVRSRQRPIYLAQIADVIDGEKEPDSMPASMAVLLTIDIRMRRTRTSSYRPRCEGGRDCQEAAAGGGRASALQLGVGPVEKSVNRVKMTISRARCLRC